MEIAKRYLTKAMEYVSFINASQLMSCDATDEPVTKKIKTVESRLNRKEKCYKYTFVRRNYQRILEVSSIMEDWHPFCFFFLFLRFVLTLGLVWKFSFVVCLRQCVNKWFFFMFVSGDEKQERVLIKLVKILTF